MRRTQRLLFVVLAFLLEYGAAEFWREVRYATGRAAREQWLGLHEEQDLRRLEVQGSLTHLTETISYHTGTSTVREETISMELPEGLGCLTATAANEEPRSLLVEMEGAARFAYRFLEAPQPGLPFATMRFSPEQGLGQRVTHFDYDGDTRFDAYCEGDEHGRETTWHILMADGEVWAVEGIASVDSVWTADEMGGNGRYRLLESDWVPRAD